MTGAAQPERDPELARLREELLELSISEEALRDRSEHGVEQPRDRGRRADVSRRLGELTKAIAERRPLHGGRDAA